MQHSFKILFKSYYIYTVSFLNLFKNNILYYMFRPSLAIIRCSKLFVVTAVLAFCASNVRCVVPSYVV
jgi:hypothetical protein